MASIWQAPQDIRQQVATLKDEYFPHLVAADQLPV